MKNIICFLMLMMVTSSCRAEETDYREVRAASYQILMATEGRCSGTMIAANTMLTAKHCIRAEMKVNGKNATLLKVSQYGDAVLLSVDIPCPCITIAERMVPIDYKIIAVGYPANLAIQTADEGRYQGLEIDRDVFSAAVMKGKSGGGIFAKINNEWRLVGVTTESTSFADNPVWTYTVGPKFSIIQELVK